MAILAEPVFHDIKDSTDWPQQISRISHQLFRPLPNSVVSEAHERRQFLSLGSWELYEEALSSSLVALRDEDAIEPPTNIVDLMDSILSCVTMVKIASSIDASQGHKQARLSWVSVLTQLGVGISEDVVVLEDSMFLRARTMEKFMVTDDEDVVGRSSLLLATLFDPPLDTTDMGEPDMKINETEPDIRSCNYTTASEASGDGLDIPLDAHILPGCGKRVNCLLPVVCVAPEHEIEALITTVVCQRYVLDINVPVVGVSLPACGTTAKIILGWATWKESDSVPVIHMAFTQGSTIHPSIGVFDLLDPASMLYFAQFILWLHPYYSSFRECRDLRTRNFCWRLDHIRYDHPIQCSDSSSNGQSRIADWLRGVYTESSEADTSVTNHQSLAHIMASKKPGSSTHSKSSGSSHFLQVPAPQSRRGRSSSRSRQQTAQQTGGSSDSSSDESDSYSQPPASAGLTASYYPASSFANLSPETGAQDKWLWERRTIRLFRIELFQPDSDLKRQVCEMIQEYNRMIQYSWPASWNRISQVPSRDPVHEDIRQQLFGSYQECKSRESSFTAMEEDVFRSINSHISALYRAVANARASQRQAKVKEAKEAALRSSWDELLKAVCCDVDEASSTCVIVETSIPLPRNRATELRSTFGADHQALIPENILSKQLYASAQDPNVPKAIRMAVTTSYFRAQASRPSTILTPEDRSYEPATAIVDAICYLQYDIRTQKGESRKNKQTVEKHGEFKGWMARFIKKISPRPSLKKLDKLCNGRDPSNLPPTIDKDDPASRHTTCYMCPFVTQSLNVPSWKPTGSDSVRHREVHIPYLYAEYKRDPSREYQAFHQAQMYLTFGVEFLAALGIKDEPVWALVTSGTTGTIIMAWKSTAEKAPNPNSAAVEYNFIIDQYVRSFDISQPLEALQLMVCLRRIYQRGMALQAKLMQQIDPSVFRSPAAAIQDRMMPARSDSKPKARSAVVSA